MLQQVETFINGVTVIVLSVVALWIGLQVYLVWRNQ